MIAKRKDIIKKSALNVFKEKYCRQKLGQSKFYTFLKVILAEFSPKLLDVISTLPVLPHLQTWLTSFDLQHESKEGYKHEPRRRPETSR